MRYCNLCIEQCCDYERAELNDRTKELFCNIQKEKTQQFFFDYLGLGV